MSYLSVKMDNFFVYIPYRHHPHLPSTAGSLPATSVTVCAVSHSGTGVSALQHGPFRKAKRHSPRHSPDANGPARISRNHATRLIRRHSGKQT